MNTIERFVAKIDTGAGCWHWTASVNSKGYGVFQGHLAHRYAYEQFVGPIPAGLTIDHVCANKLCVNPAHLQAVTVAENNRRKAIRLTHCKRGHPLFGENVRWRGNARQCRACQHDVYDAGRVR